VFFRFYTGTRPSEAAALKWGTVDLLASRAAIQWSRTLGEENAPKTEASARTFSLLPNVVDLLKVLLPLHVRPDDYVFRDEQSRPIDQNEFGRKFGDVLRVLEIRATALLQHPAYLHQRRFNPLGVDPEFRSRDFKGKNLGLKWEGEAGSG
jgi:integrase